MTHLSLPPFGLTAIWRVLTTFTSGPWALATLIGEIVLLGSYLRGVHILALRGRRWPLRRTLAFTGGIISLALAWQSGIPVFAGSIFTVHILQHLLLMSLAPILFAISSPVTLAMQTIERRRKVALLKAFNSRGMRLVTNQIFGGVGNYGIMFWFFLDHGIAVAMPRPWLMDVVNILFLVFGALVWWPVLSIDYLGRRRYPDSTRVLLAAAGMPFDTIVAISLLMGGATASIAPKMYTITNVQEGAQVFWILVMFISGVGAAIPAWQWFKSEQHKGARNDALLGERAVVRSDSRYGWWANGGEVAIEADGTMRVPWATDPSPDGD